MKFISQILAVLSVCALSAYGQSSIKTTDTLVTLKLVQPDSNYQVQVLGWASALDGGGGIYTPATQAASTNYGVVASTVNTNMQWVRKPGLVTATKAPRTQTVTAASTLTIESDVIAVAGTSGATVLTNNQTLASGTVDGQLLTIVGTSDTDTVQLVDAGTLTAGGTMALSATNFVMGVGDIIRLRYSTTTTNWHEVSRSAN
jgi:hypothetical protein